MTYDNDFPPGPLDEDNAEFLQGDGSDEPFLDSAQIEILPDIYPDYDFNPERKYFADGDLRPGLEPRPYKSKLAFFFRYLAEVTTSPETGVSEFDLFAGPGEGLKFRAKQLGLADKFMQQHKHSIVDPERAILAAAAEMSQKNHPALQLLGQVRKLNISDQTFDQLFNDVVVITNWRAVPKAYRVLVDAENEARNKQRLEEETNGPV